MASSGGSFLSVQVVGAEKLSADLARIGIGMSAGLEIELARMSRQAHQKIVSSTEPPYRTGFTRRSTGLEIGKAIFSTLPWARIWDQGGVVEPSGFPITIPKTEWISGPVQETFEDVEDRLAALFDTLARGGAVL